MRVAQTDLNDEQQARFTKREVVVQSDYAEILVPPLPQVPSMISSGESRYLYWLTSQCYTGAGAVVEVGTWLGCSTLHLAAGLRDSGTGANLHCFDNFVWCGTSDNEKSGMNMPSGADFQPHFLRNIAPLQDRISVTRAEFSAIRWPQDQPIEILFLDGPKTAAHLSACLSAFRGALVPGFTLIVFQDYQHPMSFDLPLSVQTLGGALALRQTIASGGTVSFRLEQPLSDTLIAVKQLDWRGRSAAALKQLWAELLAPLDGPVLQRMKSAYALHLCELGDLPEAKRLLREVEFDSRLHAGWSRWQTLPPLIKKYKALFEVYRTEIQNKR